METSNFVRLDHANDSAQGAECAWVARVNGGVLSDDDLRALLDRRHVGTSKDVMHSGQRLPLVTTLRLGDVDGLVCVEEALLNENSVDKERVGVVVLEAEDLSASNTLAACVVDDALRFESSKWRETADEGQGLNKSWKQVVRWGSPMIKISILRVQKTSQQLTITPFPVNQATILYHIVIEPQDPGVYDRWSFPNPAKRDNLSADAMGMIKSNMAEHRRCVLPPVDTGFCQPSTDQALGRAGISNMKDPLVASGGGNDAIQHSQQTGSAWIANANISKQSISFLADYFGREPLINSLVKSGWTEVLHSCLNESAVTSKPEHQIDPSTFKYVKRIRSGGNWLVKPPLGLAFRFCADVIRDMLTSKKRAKTVIIVRSTDRGDLLESRFRRLKFERVAAFSGKKKKLAKGWKEELRALDIMILTAQFFTNAISTGSAQVSDIDLLIVDECETTKHTNSHNLAMGAFKREDSAKTQVLGIYTGEGMDVKHPDWVQLCNNLCVPLSNVLLLDNGRDFDRIVVGHNSSVLIATRPQNDIFNRRN